MGRIAVRVRPEPDDPSSLMALIDVEVDGTPVRLRLDTGASSTTVPTSTVGNGAGGTARFLGASGSATERRTAVAATLRAGDVLLGPLEVALAADDDVVVLGTDALSGRSCEFRFADGVVLLDEPAAYPVLHDLELIDTIPVVPVDFGSATLPAIWDTGAGLSGIDERVVAAHPGLWTPLPHGSFPEGRDAHGQVVRHRRGTLRACTIGGIDVPAAECVAIDLTPLEAAIGRPVPLIIGLPTMLRATWLIDWRNRTWSAAAHSASRAS